VLDDRQDVQTGAAQGDGLEEVAGQHGVGPQDGFSRARRSTSWRMQRTVRGRPGRLGRDLAA
jgi:hypothetical protein